MKINVELLRNTILANSLSYKEVSEKTGVSAVSLNKALKGKNISVKVVGKLARGLDIPPSKLLDLGYKSDFTQ